MTPRRRLRSYEMALTAVFRAMGDEIPEEFAVVYLE